MFLKIILVRFMDRNLVKNVINGVNLVKIGHVLGKTVKIGSFWRPKWCHMSKFGVNGKIIFSLIVSKNYFSQVYGQKCGKNVINGVNLVKIGHFV